MGKRKPYVEVVKWEKEGCEPENYHPEIVINGGRFLPWIYERDRWFYTKPADANNAATRLGNKLGIEVRLFKINAKQ